MSEIKTCPVHRVKLVAKRTKYGPRFNCPAPACDVMCWGGNTSTPADQATRDARQRAHAAFDPHFKGSRRRYFAYVSLSRVLGKPMSDCHMGIMSLDDCQRVVMACEYGLVIDNIVERDERHSAMQLSSNPKEISHDHAE